MSTSLEMLDFIAPEFSGLSAQDRNTALTMAGSRMSHEAWGTLYQQGACYLAAHLLKIRDRADNDFSAAGFIGAVTSIRTGDLSVSGPGFAAGRDPDDAALQTTEYGQEYLHLRSLIVTSPLIVRS